LFLNFNICWINFIIEKILDASKRRRRRNQNALLSAENAKKRNAIFKLTTNVFYKKQDGA
jgi:predicted alpha-1,6-mannanase (GH76 family)